MQVFFPRRGRLVFAVLLAAALLSTGLSPGAGRQQPGEPFTRAFAEMMQSPHLDTRLQAYFRSPGLPERPEHVRVLRSKLPGAEPLERAVIVYALAVMTREPEDIDAFLDAFPADPELFYSFFAAEWELSGTFNTGVANFLLLLVHERRTRDRALPCLARLAHTNVAGPSEFLSRYREEPVVASYIEKHRRTLYVEAPDSYVSSFSPSVEWTDFTASLMQSDDLDTRATAVAMAGRQSSWDKPQEVLQLRRTTWGVLLERLYDKDAFINAFPLDEATLRELLTLERRTFRPPLDGAVSTLLGAAHSPHRARVMENLRAVRRYGNDFLEEYERQQLLLAIQEEKP